jgi:uncharacterized protein YjdB
MKAKLFLIGLLALWFTSSKGQQLIQGTIKPGATASEIEVWLKPNFSNSTKYLFQIGMPIAFPTSAAPVPTGLSVTLDAGFTAAFGTNYSVTVNPVASNTGGTEKYFNIVLIRGGVGASNAQTWTSGVEFKVLKATFLYSGSPASFLAKLADYQDGGSDGQGNFYTQSGNSDFYVTSNSVGNFYASPGNSIVGGTAAAGYAQLMAAVNAGTVSGTTPLCIGATASYTSNGDAGGSWSSTNTAVATVNASSGLVTAVSAGTTNITYTVSSVSAFKTLTVSPNASAGTVSGSSPLCTSATATYTSNGDAGGSWSSSNPSVASVNASSGLVTAVSAGTANIIYTVNSGCNNPVSSFAILTVSPNANAGTVSGTSPLTIGGTATYTSNGDAGGSWSSSNPSVASVNASSGLVTAVSAGTANIIYTVNSGCNNPVSSFQLLTVNAPTNAGTVSGTSPLCIGGTATYTSNGDAGGSWSSSNPSVASVNASSGLVTALSAGTTDITYTVNSVSSFKTLTVSPNVSAGTVSGTSPLCTSATATYSSNGTAGGSWSSSNPSVASVNASSGLVTALSAGTTNITYTVNSGCGSPVSSFATLTVNANVSAGTVSGTSPLCVSATATYTSNGTAGGSWSSSNPSVASVNASSGLVTAVSAGTSDITYTVNSGCGSPQSASKTLTVNTVPTVAGITGTTSLSTGGTTQLSDATAGGVWSSNNTSVATVNASGLVTGVSAGSATISYKVTNSCGNTTVTAVISVSQSLIQGTIKSGASSNEVEVWLKPNFSNSTQYLFQIGMPISYPASAGSQPTALNVTLNPGFVSAFGSNYSVTVNPIAQNTGGTEKYFNIVLIRGGVGASNAQNWTAGVEFKVLTASFVPATAPGTPVKLADYQDGGSDGQGNFYTQDGNGNYYVISNSIGNFYASPGQSTVGGTASAGYAQTIVSIGCSMPVVAAISGSSVVCAGSTTQLSDATAGGVWSSNNTSVATVNGSGLVSGVSAGSVTISYAVTNSCGTTTVTKIITVNQGTSSSFNASACNNYTLPWGGSATTSGDYTHTYTGINGCDSIVTAHVTINTAPVVAAITGTTSLSTGGTTQLSDATAGGVWSSNNTSVATVNASGLVTGVSSGSATISYAVTNSCGTTTVTAVISVSQSLIQGTIKSGASPNEVEVWLKPNFSNSTQYLFQIGMPIAYPASASVQPTSLNVTLDPGFVSAFGNNYSVTVNPIAQNTGATEKYFNIVLIRGGIGASDAQSWTAGVEFKVLTASFVPGTAPASLVKLADYQDGGSDGQGNFYTQDGNSNYYVTSNSVGNFYASPGQSTVGGTASAGYAQTIVSVGCTMPVVAAISGAATVCAGSSIQLSDATAGGVWSSNNTSVATVNGSGLVSGVLAGSATISYAVTNSCGTTTVTKIITVNQGSSSSFNATACNSYMLPWGTVVGTSGDYTHTYAAVNGCDSVVTAHVTINQSTSSSFNASGCGSYTLPWSTVVTTSGNYTHTYTGVNGCDSLVTAHVTINQATSSSFSASGCGSYTLPWSTVVSTSGDYTHTYTGVNGCDSVVTAHITIGTSVTSSFSASGCGSYTLPWSVVVTTSGDYSHTYQAIGGCDSVVTAHITINQSTSSSFNATACDGYSLPWGGSATTSGNYVHTYTGINGCDSVVTAHVTINHSATSSFSASGCNSYTLPWSVVVTTSGNYVHTYQTIGGCDSVVTAHITINHSASSSFSASGCGSYTLPWGSSVTTSGDYTHTYQTINGCDSIVTAHVTINQATSSSFNATACNSYSLPWGGSVTTTGNYVHTYTGINGCDSVVTAHVTINHSSSSTTSISICASALPYTWNNNSYPAGGTYVVHLTNAVGCDSAATLVLTILPNVSAGTVSGTSPLSVGGTATYTSNGTAGGSWSSSNTSVASVNASSGLVSALSAGTTNIIYTVNSGCGSPVSSFKTLTVNPAASITVNCPGNLTATTTSCNKSVATSNPTYSGPVVALTWSMSGATGLSSGATGINFVGTKTFNVGVTTVTYTVKDASGATAVCSFTVTVKESKAPTISCPASITQNTATGLCSKTIAVANPSVSDNCGLASVSWVMSGATVGSSPTTGINYVGTQTFNKGVTTITYTVKDASGNSATCSFTVKVVDTQSPQISCPGDITTTVTSGCSKSISVPNPVYSDNCGSVTLLSWAMIGATNAVSPLTGINTIGTRTFNVGTTYVGYLITDASGNINACSFTVTVLDNVNPTISCPGNITQTISGNKCNTSVTTPNPTFSDNCGVSKLTWVMSGATTGSSASYGINYVGSRTFNVGITTVTYTVKDGSGNSASCSYTVKVMNSHCPNSPARKGNEEYTGSWNRNDLDVSVMPNPSEHQFRIVVRGEDVNSPISLRVMDVNGKVIEARRGLVCGQTIVLGDLYKNGVYMVELVQGDRRKVVRLVKL